MRHLRYTLAMIVAAFAVLPLTAQQSRKSPHETVSKVLDGWQTGNRVTVIYGRPYTKDPKTGEPRTIWGGLVPWGDAYRLGADEATTLITQQAIVIGGASLPAGAYTLYLIPSDKGPSKLAVSSLVGEWGEPVDESHDLTRVEVKKDSLAAPVDQLTISISKDPSGGGLLEIKWATTGFSVAIKPPAARIDFPAASPTATLSQRLGVTDITVVYSRPSAKGRVMLGGNNPYGTVWRTGANSATTMTFSTPVTIQGSHLDAGSYEVYSIPGEDQWVVIFQKAAKHWGAYTYDAKDDVLRVTAKPVALASPVETFTIDFNDILNESATLNLIWEKTRVPLAIATDAVGVVVPRIEAAMAAPGTKPYGAAAMFYVDHNLDLDKALAWMKAAIAEDPSSPFMFALLYQEARILAKKGDKAGAEAAAQKSIDAASKESGPARDEYIRLNKALIAGLK